MVVVVTRVHGEATDADCSGPSLGSFQVAYEVVAFTRPPPVAANGGATAPAAVPAGGVDRGAKSASPAPFKGAVVVGSVALLWVGGL